MPICHLCMEDAVENILDLGVQPICNRFQESVSNAEPVYPMVLGQCHACGLVQMTNPVPASELKPLYDWVSYREPEKHLDQLVDILCSLSGVTLASSICGVSHADTPLLNRLKDRGFSNTWNIDPHRDLGINDPNAGIETIQGKIT
ncbi:MAG: hypothetical protein KAR13_07245, partial [Desulfobulbaceae bacterium]|nr:hypothetical protein [Desulfobulbaceae bacterium]